MIRLRKVSQTQQGIKQQAHYLGNTPMTRQGPETGPKQKQRQTCALGTCHHGDHKMKEEARSLKIILVNSL